LSKSRIQFALVFIMVLMIGISAAVLLYFYHLFYQTEYFLPGVTIASVPVEGYNTEQAINILERELLEQYKKEVVFFYGDKEFTIKLSQICLPIDTEEVVYNVWNSERGRHWKSKLYNIDGSRKIRYPVKLRYNESAIKELLDDWGAEINEEPSNAYLELDPVQGLTVKPEKAGRAVEMEGTINGLPSELTQGETIRVPIVVEERIPEVKAEDLKNTGELASYTTWYNVGDQARTNNLKLAAKAIHGSVVLPGRVFSFNETVGERTLLAGYQDALVIVGGKFIPGIGGGICQVSSTLYNTCLLAGLEIVERHNHALAVAYVPVGRDATVAYGLQDFRFKNNTGYPIYIRAVSEGGKLTISLYGNLEQKAEVKIIQIIDKVMEYQEIRETVAELEPGTEEVKNEGFPGYGVRIFRVFYDRNGQLIKEELVSRDYYQPLNKLIHMGPPKENETPLPPDAGSGTAPDEQPEPPRESNEPEKSGDEQNEPGNNGVPVIND
jgi:vancomycin resistance protein YoaR